MLCLSSHAAAVSAQGAGPSPPELARAVDSLAAHVVATGLAPAIGVAVVMDGRTVLARSHGFADVTRGVRADDRTLWYLASTSKSFTGFAASLLADEGVIRFDAPITQLVPRARWHTDARPETLTLSHFLAHTHGLQGGTAVVTNAAFTGAIPEARWPELLVWSAPTGSSDLVYSNLGYNVAAMAIDARRPEGWRRFMDQRVYGPAGMRDTYARVSGLDASRIAKPHVIDADGRYVTATFHKTDATMNSAGGHLSTVHDLARWVTVQMDSGRIDGRQVFPSSAVALSQRTIAPQTRPNAKRFAYFDRHGWAAGWDVGAYEGEPMVSRFGSYHTTRSHVSFLSRRRIGVVVETTGRAAWTATDVIAAFAYDLEAGRPDAMVRAEERLRPLYDRLATDRRQAVARDSAQRARPIPSSTDVAKVAGRYSHPGYGTVVFGTRNGRLHYEWGVLSGPVDLVDASRGQWSLEFVGSPTQVQFANDREGPATSVQLRGITFTRAPE
ncbi:MAG TPA: serine hydrolase [Gemmatimonadaceae bacterium]|nr:serine hydrolase [Gemmatimonadaceae bacterium]